MAGADFCAMDGVAPALRRALQADRGQPTARSSGASTSTRIRRSARPTAARPSRRSISTASCGAIRSHELDGRGGGASELLRPHVKRRRGRDRAATGTASRFEFRLDRDGNVVRARQGGHERRRGERSRLLPGIRHDDGAAREPGLRRLAGSSASSSRSSSRSAGGRQGDAASRRTASGWLRSGREAAAAAAHALARQEAHASAARRAGTSTPSSSGSGSPRSASSSPRCSCSAGRAGSWARRSRTATSGRGRRRRLRRSRSRSSSSAR